MRPGPGDPDTGGGSAARSAQTFRIVEYAVMLLGVVLFLSPWVLGFAGLASIAWTAWIIGVLLVVLAGSEVLGATEQRPPATA